MKTSVEMKKAMRTVELSVWDLDLLIVYLIAMNQRQLDVEKYADRSRLIRKLSDAAGRNMEDTKT
jgi:hypothetical protein